MVRINLIEPKALADQHLVAEYLEILMLAGHAKKFPEIRDISEEFCLGKGHISFFKNKMIYLKKRHELIKKEMKNRGFAINKTLIISRFPANLKNDWDPNPKDIRIIKERLVWKINKKPDYYRYYGEKKSPQFLIKNISRASSPVQKKN
jgi:deoxyribonuclease (pyrimidine dimer)